MTRAVALTALMDQTNAAAREADNLLHAIAEHEGTRVQHHVPGPAARAILTRMQSRVLDTAAAGHPTLCKHLSYTAPAVAFWVAHKPGKIRCADCAQTADRAVQGTREDRTCDHCRRVVPRIYPNAALLPAAVIDLAPLPLTAVPPIQVNYGLCPDCRHADHEGAR